MIDKNITVVTTSFNDSLNIEEYLESIFSQTLLPKKIIITDGGSTDNTLEIIEKLTKEAPCNIKIIKGENLNISQGFNLSIRSAETEFLLISCIGNIFDKNFILSLKENLIKKEADISYGALYGKGTTMFSKIYIKLFLANNTGLFLPFPSNRGVLIRKKCFEECGYFKEKLKYAGEDWEFFVQRLKNRDYKLAYNPNARLYWEVPKNLKEYLKKQKNYCIADMELLEIKDFMNVTFFLPIFSLFLIIFFFIGSNEFKCLVLCLLSMFYTIFFFKKRTINVFMSFLKIMDSFVVMYYHLKNFKYFWRRRKR